MICGEVKKERAKEVKAQQRSLARHHAAQVPNCQLESTRLRLMHESVRNHACLDIENDIYKQ